MNIIKIPLLVYLEKKKQKKSFFILIKISKFQKKNIKNK